MDIEKRINAYFKNPKPIKKMQFEEAVQKKIIMPFKEKGYIQAVKRLVDIDIIRKKYVKIIYDPFFATGRKYFPRAVRGIANCTMIHGKRDTLFGGLHPEPTGRNLKPLKQRVIKANAKIGLATDGDADRFGVVDSNGSFISPNMVLPIIYYYLLTERKMKGNVARTVATTHLLDKIARAFGYEAIETPVGFKYIGDAVVRGKAIFGGEESGGATIKNWLADKDGIFVDLMVLEIVSRRNKPMKELFNELTEKFGEIHSERLDFSYRGNKEEKEKNLKALVHSMKEENDVKRIIEIDGTKIIFDDGSWILFRFSGTEPKIRVYCEADNKNKLQALTKRGADIVKKSLI
jgi:phosphomannomutase